MCSKKYKVGYICGCFDLFHVGHLNILEKCYRECDRLVVGICDDNYIETYKKRKPIYSQEERKRIVESLYCVDMAVIVSLDEILNKKLVWDKIKFDVLFNGSDWIGSSRSIKAENDMKEIGVCVEYFQYTDGVSTTDIINRIKRQRDEDGKND